ncbi:hypothetical protein FD755_011163, partial [Muntiacus reevesi]
ECVFHTTAYLECSPASPVAFGHCRGVCQPSPACSPLSSVVIAKVRGGTLRLCEQQKSRPCGWSPWECKGLCAPRALSAWELTHPGVNILVAWAVSGTCDRGPNSRWPEPKGLCSHPALDICQMTLGEVTALFLLADSKPGRNPIVSSLSLAPTPAFLGSWLILLGTSRRACQRAGLMSCCYDIKKFHEKGSHVQEHQVIHAEKPRLTKSISVADPGNEEQGLLSRPAVETCLESLRLLEASPVSNPPSPTDLPEPRGTMEHTNNKIENIYIMKADTVIVGTVKAEVPEGQGPVGSAGPELEEELETDYASHYPEQETEPPLGSCGDVMFSVEEEGKEDPLPTTVSEK